MHQLLPPPNGGLHGTSETSRDPTRATALRSTPTTVLLLQPQNSRPTRPVQRLQKTIVGIEAQDVFYSATGSEIQTILHNAAVDRTEFASSADERRQVSRSYSSCIPRTCIGPCGRTQRLFLLVETRDRLKAKPSGARQPLHRLQRATRLFKPHVPIRKQREGCRQVQGGRMVEMVCLSARSLWHS